MKKGQFTKARVAAMIAMDGAGHSAREIGRQLECSPNTVTAYVSRAADLVTDPVIKKLVEKWRETEADELVMLRAKARSRLNEKLDQDELKPIELIALQDRAFQQSRLLEGKATAHMAFKSILQIQQAALDLTVQHCSGNHDKCDPASCEEARAAPKRKDTGRPQTRRQRAATA